ncbi:site-specific DNA-methyltransferase [Mesorhizobium sp. BR1-1-13]|uniref:site-specific DNA-methyltransferase n=1 Tax=Mesorhizobium sp. BR1-1-13 TaxID=2876656 RepID=UPI001CD0E3AB|nr:site-specific DNA-methyltransferase [Mesorhizobium sp. BR1-1-13]MBZ9944491.1 site-specific DNA-methyltransferase [Mesorhizobium sp. BR1-1-13]
MNKPEQAEPEKMDLHSMDVAAEKRAELRRSLEDAFPGVFTEGAIDFDQLKRELGIWVDPGKERFGLNWPGKAECMRIVQQPSVATLKPVPDQSVNFDTTGNVFIEGDNLEVLKLLQKSYFSKIKMIYIDPPYNTGNEFIYPDKFAETLDTYLSYTNQLDSGGRRFSTNADSAGRYHSRWLTMMYPRLYLARNLLREDGAIFISIDDNEVGRLRELCDQIFGEENFVATVIWQKVFSPKNSAAYFSEDHDYIVIYARNKEVWRPALLPRSDSAESRYENPDDDARGAWTSGDLLARNFYGKGTYEVTGPGGKKFSNPKGSYWRVSKENFDELNEDGRIWWGSDGNNMPRLKRFLSEVKQGVVPQTLWKYTDVGHTQEAKKELLEYVAFENTENVLNSLKPTRLLRRAMQIGTRANEGDIILDFFAGSASTGHAAMLQNAEDGGNRRFILVQLPEPLPTEEASVRTIADLGKSRLRKAGQVLAAEAEAKLDLAGKRSEMDTGFRLLRLDRSNFRIWDGDSQSSDIGAQLELHVDHVSEASSAQDILFELMLKSGFLPTTAVSTEILAGTEVFSIEGGALLICLAKQITPELIDALAEANPLQVICLDEGFKGNDQLKTNAVQTFKARAQAEESEIVFKTV